MKKTVVTIFATVFLVTVTAFAEFPKDSPTWSDRSADSVEKSPTPKTTVSGRAFSILYDDFNLDMRKQDAPAVISMSKTINFKLEYDFSLSKVLFKQDIRGYLTKDKNTRAIINLILPNKTETIVYPYGQAVSDIDFAKTFTSKMKWNKDQYYAATITIRLEKRTPAAIANVSLDSFDVVVKPLRP